MLNISNKKLLLMLSLFLPFTIIKAVDQEPILEKQDMENACGCGGGNVSSRPRPNPRPTSPRPNPNQTPNQNPIPFQRPHGKGSILHRVLSGLLNDKSGEYVKSILNNLPEESINELPDLRAKLEDIQSKVGPELEELIASHGQLILQLLEILLATEA